MSSDKQGTTSQKQQGEPVSFQDWEPRALPSDARCRVWAEKGGVWHLTHEEAADGAFCMARGERSGYQSIADKPLWRPWLKGEPAGWNATFYPVTHPPIPEGLERIGEWRTGLGAPRDLPLVFFEDGTTMRDPGLILGSVWFCEVRRTLPAIPEGWEAVGEWFLWGKGSRHLEYDATLTDEGGMIGKSERVARIPMYGCHVRRAPPPADWGDVPRGVTLRPTWGGGGPCNNVVLNGAYVGRVLDQSEEGYSTHGTNQKPVEGSPFASLPAAIVALTGRRTG